MYHLDIMYTKVTNGQSLFLNCKCSKTISLAYVDGIFSRDGTFGSLTHLGVSILS